MDELEPGTIVDTPLGRGVVRNSSRTRGAVTAILVQTDADRELNPSPLWRVFDPEDVTPTSAAVGDSAVTEPLAAGPDMAPASGALPQAAPSGVAPGEPVQPPKESST